MTVLTGDMDLQLDKMQPVPLHCRWDHLRPHHEWTFAGL